MRTILATLIAFLALAAPAQAFVLGVGDGAQFPAQPSADLGATVYRVVIDPALGLESYDARINEHRAVGQRPQLVIGGTGTQHHKSTKGLVQAAVAASKRWPDAYSISVVNEPNESGMGVCEYARVWVQAHRAIKGMRLLFGEWSPRNDLDWHHATLSRCSASPTLRRVVRHVAFHGYWESLNYGRDFRDIHRDHKMRSPKLYMTEAGGVLKAGGVASITGKDADLVGLRYWRKALRIIKRDRITMVVAWGLHDESGHWRSGLIDGNGRRRPAFGLLANR